MLLGGRQEATVRAVLTHRQYLQCVNHVDEENCPFMPQALYERKFTVIKLHYIYSTYNIAYYYVR